MNSAKERECHSIPPSVAAVCRSVAALNTLPAIAVVFALDVVLALYFWLKLQLYFFQFVFLSLHVFSLFLLFSVLFFGGFLSVCVTRRLRWRRSAGRRAAARQAR